MKNKSDLLFLAITGALIINTIVQSSLSGYQISINNYLGFLCWAIVLILKFASPRLARYGTGMILILESLGIINFSAWKTTLSVGLKTSGRPIETPGVDPLIFLLLLAFYIINKKAINRVLSDLFRGSAEERQTDLQKKTEFYLKMFESYNLNELNNLFDSLNDYPPEAQTALMMLKSKKEEDQARQPI